MGKITLANSFVSTCSCLSVHADVCVRACVCFPFPPGLAYITPGKVFVALYAPMEKQKILLVLALLVVMVSDASVSHCYQFKGQ